jgi:hypothetical protein
MQVTNGTVYLHRPGRNQGASMNLPIVPVMTQPLKNDNLIIATQGRSLWIHDDLNLVRQAF